MRYKVTFEDLQNDPLAFTLYEMIEEEEEILGEQSKLAIARGIFSFLKGKISLKDIITVVSLGRTGFAVMSAVYYSFKLRRDPDDEGVKSKLKRILERELNRESLHSFLKKMDPRLFNLLKDSLKTIDDLTGWGVTADLDKIKTRQQKEEEREQELKYKYQPAGASLSGSPEEEIRQSLKNLKGYILDLPYWQRRKAKKHVDAIRNILTPIRECIPQLLNNKNVRDVLLG
jgi:hypothetical protein